MKNRIMINNATALWILDRVYQSIYMYSVILEKEIPINIFILRKNVKIFVLSWLSPTLICLCFLLSMKVINNKRVHFQTGFCSYTHIYDLIVTFGISQTFMLWLVSMEKNISCVINVCLTITKFILNSPLNSNLLLNPNI